MRNQEERGERVIRIAVVGRGAMGTLVKEQLELSPFAECAGVVGRRRPGEPARRGCYEALASIPGRVDVVIDFSHPACLDLIEAFARENRAALVMGTTGYGAGEEERIRRLGELVPVVRSSNFSTGIAVLRRVLSMIAPVLGEDYDMELVEKHHRKKADAPSGTAKLLLQALDGEGLRTKVYGRCGQERRQTGEIGIHAVRGGTIVGEHTVLFAGENEVLELTHRAESKGIFVNGALRAARFAAAAVPGYYGMEDVLWPGRHETKG